MPEYNDLLLYRKKVQKKLSLLKPVFANAAIGKFDVRFDIPEGNDEFSELFAGILIMMDVIRGKYNDLSGKNSILIKEKSDLEKSKEDFISIASHQLRTPLSIMRLNLEILSKKLDKNPELTKIHNNLYQNTLRMVTLVNDLLNIARIEQGNFRGNPEKVNPVHIINRIYDHLELEIKKKKVNYSFKNRLKRTSTVVIDPKNMFMVLNNILTNAIKYNHKSGGKIILTIGKRNGTTAISITDNGIGIPPEDKNKIFAKFFRTKSGKLTEVNGSGLGLFIAKSYVESWGGKISFKSPVYKNGSGTKVIFTIP